MIDKKQLNTFQNIDKLLYELNFLKHGKYVVDFI